MSGEIERQRDRAPVQVTGPRERTGRFNTGFNTGRQPGSLDPEWVMVGVDVPAGKRLYASRDLKESAFQVAVADHSWTADGWHLTTTMQRMLVITKPTYAECLAELMTIWRNWENAGRELPVGRGGGGEYGSEAFLPASPGIDERRRV